MRPTVSASSLRHCSTPLILWSTLSLGAVSATGAEITVLHTNDLHSHFRGERTPLGLGGIARIKTQIDQVKAAVPHSVVVDAGDWSEGNIYYNLGAGVETLRMMDQVGYDLAVIGNHDWLNGPDTLLRIVQEAKPRLTLLAANADATDYARRLDFERVAPPYVIREIGDVRVAFIGLITYEFIYDRFLKPVKVLPPFALTRELSARLKRQADAVVVISHNRVGTNEELLRLAPDVDLVISGHAHSKLTRPSVVKRPDRPDGWVVETGAWGRYLGRVDMTVLPRSIADRQGKPSVSLRDYRLYQMDETVPEDPGILKTLERLEGRLEAKYGPIFHDHVADCRTEVNRSGLENRMGNLTVDSYFNVGGADFAIDQVNLIYGELHPGELRTVDVFNANPAIYDPISDKSWTLKFLPIKGRTLRWLLGLVYSSKQLAQMGIVSTAGMRVTFDPVTLQNAGTEFSWTGPRDLSEAWLPWELEGLREPQSILQEVLIGGKPLEPNRTYTAAIGGGIHQAFTILNSVFPGAIPLDEIRETGIEDWRILLAHVRDLSPLTPDKIPMGNRIRTAQPDPGLTVDDVSAVTLGRLNDGTWEASIRARVTNFGVAPLPPAAANVKLLVNRNGVDQTRDPDWAAIGEVKHLRALRYLESETVAWTARLRGNRGLYPVTIALDAGAIEVNRSNNSVTRWFTEADTR